MNAKLHSDYVECVLGQSWDKRIVDDLVNVLSAISGERAVEIEEVRRFLAVKGFRELLQRLRVSRTASWQEGLKQVARAMRTFALERPGLSVATFRTQVTDCAEWRAAADDLGAFVLDIFAQCGFEAEIAQQGLRMLRSLVRGFVLHEATDSFLDPQGYAESYEFALNVFIEGLAKLQKDRASKRNSEDISADQLLAVV